MNPLSMLGTLILAFLLINVPLANAATHTYTDVPKSHSNYEDILYLLENDVIEASKTYGINDIVTREEVAVMIAKALGLNGEQRATAFTDVAKNNPNSGYIQSAVEAGIINGYSDGTFKPNTKITRSHMATFIARAFELPVGTQTFTDVAKGHTAYEAVQQLVAAGITTGYTDGTFKPANPLTRGHVSAFLTRALIYNELSNFNVEQFLNTVGTTESLQQQLTLVNSQHEKLDTLLQKEKASFDELVASKAALDATIVTTKEKLSTVQADVEKYHTTISNANYEIQQYRANNKHLVYGTAKQKEHYLDMLEALQQQYEKTQQEKNAQLTKRTELNTHYEELKNQLNQLRTTIKNKQQLLANQTNSVNQLKNSATAINTKIAAIERQKQQQSNPSVSTGKSTPSSNINQNTTSNPIKESTPTISTPTDDFTTAVTSSAVEKTNVANPIKSGFVKEGNYAPVLAESKEYLATRLTRYQAEFADYYYDPLITIDLIEEYNEFYEAKLLPYTHNIFSKTVHYKEGPTFAFLANHQAPLTIELGQKFYSTKDLLPHGWFSTAYNVMFMTELHEEPPYTRINPILFSHEYFHWINSNVYNGRIPSWLNEGIAYNFMRALYEDTNDFMKTSFYTEKKEVLLNDIQYDIKQTTVYIVVVAYMQSVYGSEALENLLSQSATVRFEEAFENIYGKTVEQMVEETIQFIQGSE